MDNKSWQMRIDEIANRNRGRIIFGFQIVYFLLLAVLFLGVYSIITQGAWYGFFYALGISFGKLALLLLSLTILPGILGRFAIRIQITFIITTFRRYIGILVFLLAFSHFTLVKLAPTLGLSLKPFELMGFLALFLLFFMFLTSNNWSMIILGKWWKRLHRIVYVVLWLVFLHTALQKSLWSLWIGIVALLETTSLIYSFFRKK